MFTFPVTMMSSPPASGGDAIDAIANNILRLEADSASNFTFTSGNIIESWNDASGSANHATQSVAADKPTYDSTNSEVDFADSSDQLSIASVTDFNFSGDVTIFTRVKLIGSSSCTWWSKNAGVPFVSLSCDVGRLRVRLRDNASTLYDRTYGAVNSLFDGNYHNLGIVKSGSTVTGWIDGTKQTNPLTAIGAIDVSSGDISTSSTSSNSKKAHYYWKTAASDAQIADLNTYMNGL